MIDLPVNANGEVELSIDEFFTTMAQTYPVLLIGDTGHSNEELQEFLGSNRLFSALSAGGTKMIGLEIERKNSPYLDPEYLATHQEELTRDILMPT